MQSLESFAFDVPFNFQFPQPVAEREKLVAEHHSNRRRNDRLVDEVKDGDGENHQYQGAHLSSLDLNFVFAALL